MKPYRPARRSRSAAVKEMADRAVAGRAWAAGAWG